MSVPSRGAGPRPPPAAALGLGLLLLGAAPAGGWRTAEPWADFRAATAVAGVWPAAGPAEGGENVTVLGRGLGDGQLMVRIGGRPVPVLGYGANRLSGLSPPHQEGFAMVEVAASVADFGESPHAPLYEYVRTAVGRPAGPSVLSASGDRVLFLTGQGLREELAFTLEAGATRVGGGRTRFVSSALIAVDVPATAAAGPASVGVHFPGAKGGHSVPVTLARWDVAPLSEAARLVSGGTLAVELPEARTNQDLHARFGGLRVGCRIDEDKGTGACVVPHVAPGVFQLALLLDGVRSFGAFGEAHVLDAVDVLEAAPAEVAASAEVRVVVGPRVPEFRLACSFGEGIASAARRRDGAPPAVVFCDAPPAPGFYAVGLQAPDLRWRGTSPHHIGVHATPPEFLRAAPAVLPNGVDSVVSVVTAGLERGQSPCGDAGRYHFVSSGYAKCEITPGVAQGRIRMQAVDVQGTSAVLPGAAGSEHGGDAVHFADLPLLLARHTCRFGTIAPVAAHARGGGALACEAPAHAPGTVEVAVGIDAFPAMYLRAFSYESAAETAGIAPEAGALHGAGEITVLGTHGAADLAGPCQVGAELVPGRPEAGGVVVCELPAGLRKEGFVPVALQNHAGGRGGVGAVLYDFEVHAAAKVSYHHPTTVDARGGHLVYVFGRNLHRARSGLRGVHAVQSAGLLTLESGLAEEIELAVGDAGDGATVGLEVVPTPVIEAVAPEAGPASGGAEVALSVQGLHKLQHPKCKFGTLEVAPGLVDTDVMHCTAPAAAPRAHAVGLSLGTLTSYISHGQAFASEEEVALAHVQPATTTLHGGSLSLFVRGSGAFEVDVLGCVLSTAFPLGQTMCGLRFPSSLGFVPLDLAQAGRIGNGAQIAVHPFSVMDSIYPRQAWKSVEALVHVNGRHFEATMSACQLDGRAVQSHFVSSALIVCEVPVVGEATEPVLSLSNQDSPTRGISIAVEQESSISSLSPNKGPVRGGTSVLISGSALSDSFLSLCEFGAIAVRPSRWHDGTTMECVAPAHQSGRIPLGVGMAMQQSTQTSLDFVYTSTRASHFFRPTGAPRRF